LSYLVDTNIYSEPVKLKPDPRVVAWLREHEGELHVSTINHQTAKESGEAGEADCRLSCS
jgi:predicted nucleic acid-binding protein